LQLHLVGSAKSRQRAAVGIRGLGTATGVGECVAEQRPDLEAARRNSANAARDAFTGVNFGLAQVRALESAEVSARTQLESTQLGYQVGVRILLDVLNATTQLVQTQRDLKRARYDFLLSGLRLKASSGSLNEQDITGVNALLDPQQPLTIPDPLAPPASVPPAPRSSLPGTKSSAVATATTETVSAGGAPSATAKPVKQRRK
jgi:hypothetical protein